MAIGSEAAIKAASSTRLASSISMPGTGSENDADGNSAGGSVETAAAPSTTASAGWIVDSIGSLLEFMCSLDIVITPAILHFQGASSSSGGSASCNFT